MIATRRETVRALPRLSMPALLVRAESLAFAVAGIALYASQGASWATFLLLILVPDLSMIAYLANPRVGSVVYNTVHSYVLPVLLAGVALMAGSAPGVQIALIWFTHISIDRILGFGLKYPTEFKDSHLQRL